MRRTILAFLCSSRRDGLTLRYGRACAGPGAGPTRDGVYTTGQADRGYGEYGRYCARCHGPDLDGIGAAPMLYSSRFLDRWREDSLRTLYDYVKTNMPQDGKPGPGGLTPAQYVDIVAFLLQSSELPAGTSELRVGRCRRDAAGRPRRAAAAAAEHDGARRGMSRAERRKLDSDATRRHRPAFARRIRRMPRNSIDPLTRHLER